ncbi:MAG TPA: methyltransferase domain-containing protein [Terriglobales bacterium]|nr:methyltransferase domain-containing protein [Terriglobales bacterium]
MSKTIQLSPKEAAVESQSSGSAPGTGGYDPAFFEQLSRIEDRHFWFRSRNRLILELVRHFSSSSELCNLVLEVGCGTGNVLRVLEKACPNSMVVGLELWFEGLKHARNRSGAALVQADIRNLPFRKQFDLVGMFDVLEHIPEDEATLRLAHGALRPGGQLLLTVPAHPSLWSYFDEAAHHCRRYSQEDLRSKLESAGFEVRFLTEFMASILPIVWTYRKLNTLRRKPGSTQQLASDEFRLVPVVNGILTGMLYLEAQWVSRGHTLPAGTSLVVVARKAA